MPNKSENLRKLTGKVTPAERDEIKMLFERKNGLTELFKSLDKDSGLYDRLVHDMGSVSTKFKNWWSEKAKKYKWDNKKGHHWEIDFETCEIYIIKD